ncbi:MAG TPA: 2-dehydropantoate 2-reductase N-terminal domain-containing protein [Candidatus Limnocylindrales bacterium]|nr:2-dehydropantoate 2-reductase N-terminal domain-containing protein [Candidatus Limnocylindrales bacterium]
MIVAVVGGGAVGTFLGATLAAAGDDVVLLRRSSPADLRRESITIEGPGDQSRTADLAIAATSEALSAPPDVVILAVKMPDLPGAIETAAIWRHAPVLAVGNGVGADDMLLRARTSGIIAGSLTAAVMLDRPSGMVHRRSGGGIGLALVREFDVARVEVVRGDTSGGSVHGVVEQLARSFEAGGLRVRRLRDPAAMRWSKLVSNLLGNATSAILDIEPGDVYRDPILFRFELRQVREALAVMRGLGLRPVPLPGADVRPLALATRLPSILVRPVMQRVVGGARGGKSPSLRLHLQNGDGPSEIEWLNGAVARAAVLLGMRAPVNARLAELVDECSRDRQRRDWFRGHPDRLIAELSMA